MILVYKVPHLMNHSLDEQLYLLLPPQQTFFVVRAMFLLAFLDKIIEILVDLVFEELVAVVELFMIFYEDYCIILL